MPGVEDLRARMFFAARIFKLQKYLASKLTDGKGGRGYVVSHFDEDGQTLLSAVRSAVRKYAGAVEAGQMKKHFLKLITKSMLLKKEKIITEAHSEPARAPVLACVQQILNLLDPSHVESRPTIAAISQSIKAAHAALLALLKPHVREHNSQRLTYVFDFFSDHAFIEKFTKDPAYEPERQRIFRALSALMRPFDSELRELKHCAFFSKLLTEHARTLNQMTTTPNLRDFLDSDVGTEHLARWLNECSPANSILLKFVRKIEYLKSTSNMGLREKRAEQIKTAFLDGELFNDSEKAASLTLLAQSPPKLETFDTLEKIAMDRLGALFNTEFVVSVIFESLKKEAESCERRAKAMTTYLNMATLTEHAKTLNQMIAAPHLRDFLDSDVGTEHLARWLDESSPANSILLEFVRKIEYFKSTSNMGLRDKRAEQIKTAFLEGQLVFEASEKAACLTFLAQSPPKLEAFDTLEKIAMTRLEALFNTEFVISAVFAESLKKETESLERRAKAMTSTYTDVANLEEIDDDDDEDDDDIEYERDSSL